MKVEQFVMAYQVEQDRLRALLPNGVESLRPVLRINAEIRTKSTDSVNPQETVYLELNTPVSFSGKRGWLNVAHWESPETVISYEKVGKAVTFCSPFLRITYTGTGINGGCPAEKDNDGCLFLDNGPRFVAHEPLDCRKEFCDCEFTWSFDHGNAHGISIGEKTKAAIPTPPEKYYEKQEFSAPVAATITCEQILGSYAVCFEREKEQTGIR